MNVLKRSGADTPIALPRPRVRPIGSSSAGAVSREAWRRLAVCTGAAALLQLDGTLITVALPSVAHGLGVRGGSTPVVLAAYFAAYALTLLPGGVLVDRVGARRLALLGLALFAVGASAGALSMSLGVLVATRVVQGAGAGLVSPAALAGAISGFPAERRGRALGVWGASAGMANLLGPVLGGLLTITLGWRADWWALVPLTLLAVCAIAAGLPRNMRGDGDAVVRAGVNRIVLISAFVAALTFMVMIGSFFIAEQYLQRAAGYSPLGASTVLVLVAILVGAAAPLAGTLADRRGERLPATAGFLAAGLGLLVLATPGLSLQSPLMLVPMVPVGVGLGLLFVPVSRAALNAMPPASHGRVSAVLSLGRLLGAAAGAALAGLAITTHVDAAAVHHALLVACAICLLVGIPSSARLGATR
ncbi:MAG: MFS transporter [Solirubrobacteraceae bacterium]